MRLALSLAAAALVAAPAAVPGVRPAAPAARTVAQPPAAPEVGAAAPAFEAPAADAKGPVAKPVSLAALKGKVVVLAFYPADRTGGCTAELTKFRDEYATLFGGGSDVVVLPVSKDDLASHQSWAQEMKFPFVLLSDPQLTLAEKYGSKGASWANRTVFVIGKDGKVAYRDLRFNALGEGAYKSLADAVAKARKG